MAAEPLPQSEEPIVEEPIALRRPQLEEAEMDITPMIDCTFLLLIFFLVCSHISQSAAVTLPIAKHGSTVSAKQSVIITITQGEGATAKVYRGDGAEDASLIATTDPVAQEEEILRYVEAAMREDRERQFLLVKAEKSVKHREVSRVARAAARGTDSKVKQIFIAVMEPGG